MMAKHISPTPARLWTERSTTYAIAPPVIRRDAPAQPCGKRRSPAAWLLVLIQGLAEGYAARAEYHRLADKGLRPEMALRMAFDLHDEKGRQPPSTAVPTKTEQD